MKDCPTGKVCHLSKEAAEEALVENRGRSNFGEAAGPINVYECKLCHTFHFTSKGNPHEMLSDQEVRRRIEQLKLQSYWEGRFK